MSPLLLTLLLAADPQPIHREWQIEGEVREAVLYVPDKTDLESMPVVFAFHGHGGTARNVARGFAFQEYWPEAIAGYMQESRRPRLLIVKASAMAGNRRLATTTTATSSLSMPCSTRCARITRLMNAASSPPVIRTAPPSLTCSGRSGRMSLRRLHPQRGVERLSKRSRHRNR